jgi:hypothetical protein
MTYVPALDPTASPPKQRFSGPTAQSFSELRREAIREGRIDDATEYGRMMQILDERAFGSRRFSGVLTAAVLGPLMCVPFWVFHYW